MIKVQPNLSEILNKSEKISINHILYTLKLILIGEVAIIFANFKTRNSYFSGLFAIAFDILGDCECFVK